VTTPNTMYDIASLTKVVATTTLVATISEATFGSTGPRCEDRAVFAGMGRAGRTLSGGTDDGAASADAHFGIAAVQGVLAEHRKNKQDTLTKIFAEPLDYEPGTKEVYSTWELFDGGDYRAIDRRERSTI